MRRPKNVHDVAKQHLCTGCGVCAFLAPEEVAMVDDLRQGRRPLPLVPAQRASAAGQQALGACPGRRVGHDDPLPTEHLSGLGNEWGPVLELWEGWATDPEIRFRGSSGGVATALALHCLETEGMAGVLHTGAREDVPYLNETVMSTNRSQLLERAGSRYAPASPCDGLSRIAASASPCVFIGKPCDVAATTQAASLRADLDARLGLTIAFFCAGTPTTAGTLEAVRKLGFEPDGLASVRYRGHGWPGRFTVADRTGRTASLSYEQSWGEILQKHRQWRCMICPDHTGEFADVSVGDPWYQPIGDDAGRSLVVVRSERGRRLVHAAQEAGALTLQPVPAAVLPASQPNLLRTRGAVWGRVLTMRLLGLPAPRYRGLPMLRPWLALSMREKLTSTLGTARRIRRRQLYRRASLHPFDATASAETAPADVEPRGH